MILAKVKGVSKHMKYKDWDKIDPRNISGFNKNEQEFANLLADRDIFFVPHYPIYSFYPHCKKQKYFIPDLYIEELDLFCEIVTFKAPDAEKRRMIAYLVRAKDYKFTFYHHSGAKCYMTDKKAYEYGYYRAEDIPSIPGMPDIPQVPLHRHTMTAKERAEHWMEIFRNEKRSEECQR